MATYSNTGSDRSGDAGSASVSPSVVASFLASLPAELQSIMPTIVDASSPTASLATALGIVAPGATVKLDATVRAGIMIDGRSNVDLSSSSRPDGTPVPLGIVAAGGSNRIVLGQGPAFALSLDGNDTIVSSSGHDLLRSAIGRDSLVGGGQSHIVGAVDGYDTLVGGINDVARDTIVSRGSSYIRTSFGSNVIVGGAGDTVHAGMASDTISAADGASTISGGYNSLVYGSGRSSILAGGGHANTFNLTGDDTLVAGRGPATVDLADTGRASVHGGVGHLDVNLAGRVGDDTLFGGSGGLTIHVSAGAGAIVNDPNALDADGYHVVQLAGGETLHVSNVTLDFGNGHHKTI